MFDLKDGMVSVRFLFHWQVVKKIKRRTRGLAAKENLKMERASYAFDCQLPSLFRQKLYEQSFSADNVLRVR